MVGENFIVTGSNESATREPESEPSLIYKRVVIIGPGVDDAGLLVEEFERDPYTKIIYGDRHGNSKDWLLDLSGKVDENTRFDITAHGEVVDGKHYTSIFLASENIAEKRVIKEGFFTPTSELFKILQGVLGPGKPLRHTHLWSCYGGTFLREGFLKTTPIGTSCISHTDPNTKSSTADDYFGIALESQNPEWTKVTPFGDDHAANSFVRSFSSSPEKVSFFRSGVTESEPFAYEALKENLSDELFFKALEVSLKEFGKLLGKTFTGYKIPSGSLKKYHETNFNLAIGSKDHAKIKSYLVSADGISTAFNADIEDPITGSFPIMIALANNDIDTCRMLLEHGVRIDFINKDGYNIVHSAVLGGDVSLLNLLLEHPHSGTKAQEYLKIQETTMSSSTRSPLEIALIKKDLEMTRVILSNCKEIKEEAYCENILFAALETKDLEIIKLLVEQGQDKGLQIQDPSYLSHYHQGLITSVKNKSEQAEKDQEQWQAIYRKILTISQLHQKAEVERLPERQAVIEVEAASKKLQAETRVLAPEGWQHQASSSVRSRVAIPFQRAEQVEKKLTDQIESFIKGDGTESEIKEVFDATIESQNDKPEPTQAYRGCGMKATFDDQERLMINEVFADDISTFNFKQNGNNIVLDGNNWLKEKVITEIWIGPEDSGSFKSPIDIITDEVDSSNQEDGIKSGLAIIAKAFHGQEEVKFKIEHDGGEVEFSCNQKGVFVTQGCESAKQRLGGNIGAKYNPKEHGTKAIDPDNVALEILQEKLKEVSQERNRNG